MPWDYDDFDLEIGREGEAYVSRVSVSGMGDVRNAFPATPFYRSRSQVRPRHSTKLLLPGLSWVAGDSVRTVRGPKAASETEMLRPTNPSPETMFDVNRPVQSRKDEPDLTQLPKYLGGGFRVSSAACPPG